MRSLRGHFLIASRALADPNFRRSVILMMKHDAEGAMGVVVNAPLELSVAEALGETIVEAADVAAPLHRGGPCQGPMMVLHTQPSDAAGDQLLPGLHFTASRDDIEQLMTRPTEPVRYIVGYAGWGTEQLENEIDEGSWLTVAATAHDVFLDAAEQWERLSAKAGLTKFIPPERIPDDAGLN